MFQNTGPKDKSFLKRSNNICFSLLFCWVFFLLQAFRGHATGDENRPPPRATWGFQLPPSHFLPQSEHQRKWPQSGGVSRGKLGRPHSLGDSSQGASEPRSQLAASRPGPATGVGAHAELGGLPRARLATRGPQRTASSEPRAPRAARGFPGTCVPVLFRPRPRAEMWALPRDKACGPCLTLMHRMVRDLSRSLGHYLSQ